MSCTKEKVLHLLTFEIIPVCFSISKVLFELIVLMDMNRLDVLKKLTYVFETDSAHRERYCAGMRVRKSKSIKINC